MYQNIKNYYLASVVILASAICVAGADGYWQSICFRNFCWAKY